MKMKDCICTNHSTASSSTNHRPPSGLSHSQKKRLEDTDNKASSTKSTLSTALNKALQHLVMLNSAGPTQLPAGSCVPPMCLPSHFCYEDINLRNQPTSNLLLWLLTSLRLCGTGGSWYIIAIVGLLIDLIVMLLCLRD
jgi:hypothetical protein